MRGEHDAVAFGDEMADRGPQFLARFDVHADGRFVEEQQLRPAAQRERELHAPLLAAGQLAVRPLQQIGDTGQVRAFLHAARRRVVAGGQANQFADAQGGRQLRVLQHDADVAARGDVLRILAEQFDRAGCRRAASRAAGRSRWFCPRRWGQAARAVRRRAASGPRRPARAPCRRTCLPAAGARVRRSAMAMSMLRVDVTRMLRPHPGRAQSARLMEST